MGIVDVDLTGKVAVITGGSRGLGKDIAVAMARRGAQVTICGRKQENLDKAVDEFKKDDMEVVSFPANVGKADQVEALFQEVGKKFGKLDILVNNAGMNIFTPAVAEVDEGLWDKTLETNLKGPFLTAKHGLELFKKAGGGKIINITSIAARKAAIGMGIYCVAKAGVEMLTKVLALELAQTGIKVNAVAPGMVKTQFSMPFWSNEDLLKEITKSIPMGRIAEIDDVVGAVLFLASDMSNYITGEIITVDGGSTA
ncbi:SDR family NAD(P)-dependent oxidoreductase [Thermodesulfobacteriota bacterium]